MLSTHHENATTIIHKRQSQVEKLTCIQEYNNSNGETDITNQMLASYYIPRERLKKYYKEIFIVLLDLAILNSYQLYKITTQEINSIAMTQLQFRIALVRS